jgi:hypothetical protein
VYDGCACESSGSRVVLFSPCFRCGAGVWALRAVGRGATLIYISKLVHNRSSV